VEGVVERKIALLIPVYNDPEGLRRSLESLPLEVPLDVVVVDDGSDPPLPPPEVPPPHRAFLLRLERNRGIVGALNEGLRFVLERGYPYVARLDAGDLALPGRFSAQLRFLEERPGCALVGGQVRFVDAEGRETHKEAFPTEDGAIRRAMRGRNVFIHPAVMIRTQVLREVGLYREGYPAGEDYELFFRLMERYHVANLGEEVVVCQVNPKGISLRRRRAQLLSRLRVQLENFDPRLKESWLGVAKTLGLLLLPWTVVQGIKRRFPGRSGWL
jgi:glycosyltransferase involved in cell wall biosynthesis